MLPTILDSDVGTLTPDLKRQKLKIEEFQQRLLTTVDVMGYHA